ncbi:MAG TPA: ATP-binding protein [Actinomycetota bacterium]|nr:ATP-binding protein [Actinomycetota bacterium]
MDAGWIAVVALGLIAAGVGGALLAALGLRSRLAEAERRAEAASAELQHRAATDTEQRAVQGLILDSMHEGVLLLDADLETAFTNSALDRHLGNRPASVTELFPVPLREAVRKVATSAVPITVEAELSAPSRWLRITASPAGEGSVLMVVTDITDARRIEAVRRDFVANASHELKTPAASIQAAAETLRSVVGEDPGAAPKFAVQLEREALRLSRIVADLLDLSRLESGSDLADRVRLDALAREEVERFADQAREAAISLSVSASEPATIGGSARDLSLLIRNLIDNAVRYTPPEGTVAVRVSTEGADVRLEVRDSGVGIPTRDLPRVFERFYRVDRARSRETGGTGLGLAIVRHVAENHGGSVSVTSEVGAGSTFTVRLPTTDPGPPPS